MKKVILLTAALIFSYTVVFSQAAADGGATANGADKNFHFGLNVTPGLYWLKANTPNNATNGSSFGFGYGVNLEFYFSQNYGFVTGLEVASFGAKYTNAVTGNGNLTQDSTTAHNYSLEYLEIPLELKFRTLPIGFMKYFGIVGLNPGIRLKSTDDYTVTLASGSYGNHTSPYSESGASATGETSIIRLAFVIGAGFEYNLAGTTSVQVALAYDNGFLNINSGSGSSVLSKGVTMTVGILF